MLIHDKVISTPQEEMLSIDQQATPIDIAQQHSYTPAELMQIMD